MAKKIDFKGFLTKIVNIFPKDMYIVHNWCAIAGEESDLENRGFYFCRRCGASLMQSKIYKMSESISGINLQKYSMSELKKIYKNQFEKETLPLCSPCYQ